jgi:hypothetical protein
MSATGDYLVTRPGVFRQPPHGTAAICGRNSRAVTLAATGTRSDFADPDCKR